MSQNKPATLYVRAAHPGRPVPMRRTSVNIDRATGRDRTMVYHDDPREVPNTSFYRRAVRRGDLEVVARPAPTKPAKAAKKD